MLRGSAVHVDLVAKFRKSASKDAGYKPSQEAIQLLNRLVAASIELESRVGKRQPIQPAFERQILPGNLEDQAEDLALEVRHKLGLGLAPVTDIVSLVEMELGIRIYFRPLHSSVSGVFAYDNAVGACMLVNSLHPRDRQIHTIVHELGHYFCARDVPDSVVVHESESSREERFVTLFAVAFLMPASAIRRRFRDTTNSDGSFSLRGIILLAHAFGVSFEAMARRLEALGLIRGGVFESLKDRGFAIEKSRQSLGLQLPASYSSTPRLAMMAAEASKVGLLSEGQLCRMLCLDRVELREQLDRFAGDELDDEVAVHS